MARAKRWTLPFISLNGTSCRVDIYKEGYTGSTVDTLTGAADPFYFEESDGNDLLNDVIRYRTGYINVVAATVTALDEIYPTDFFDRYVEFYYGTTLMFTGYIQVQEMSNAWTSGPLVISLPVISPLGLLDKKCFDISVMSGGSYTPTSKSLGWLLDKVVAGLNAGYLKVWFPYTYNASIPDYLSLGIYSLVVVPWNKDFLRSSTSSAFWLCYSGRNYLYLVEGICKAFQWVAHDTPEGIVFTKFGWNSTYYYYDVGHIGNTNYRHSAGIDPSSALALTSYMTFVDDSAEQSTILPYKTLKIEYEGDDLDEVEVSYDRCNHPIVNGYGSTERTSVCGFLNPTGEFIVLSNNVDFNTNHHVVDGPYVVALNGSEGILYGISDGTTTGTTIGKARAYIKTMGRNFYCKFDAQFGDFIANLAEDDNLFGLISTTVTSYDDYVEVEFKWTHPTDPIDVPFAVFITNITFVRLSNNKPYTKYLDAATDNGTKLPSNTQNEEDDTVTMPFSLYRFNQNTIGTYTWTFPMNDYAYVFAPRTKLVAKFKGSLPALYHAYKYSYWLTGGNWRIIAVGFYPWNDEYTLTMHRSTTI
jgi:hypothetical protein